MNKKGQGALEYLMTYGWALLVIVIVVAALYAMGVLNPSTYQQSRCTGFQHFTFNDQKLSTTQYVLDVRSGGTSKVTINTIKVGASLKGSLRAIINELTICERERIRNYSRELNMWVLAYMLFAVAVPTIGTTVMMILAGFAGYNMTKEMFVLFLLINFAIQYILIGFVKYRRPVVNF